MKRGIQLYQFWSWRTIRAARIRVLDENVWNLLSKRDTMDACVIYPHMVDVSEETIKMGPVRRAGVSERQRTEVVQRRLEVGGEVLPKFDPHLFY